MAAVDFVLCEDSWLPLTVIHLQSHQNLASLMALMTSISPSATSILDDKILELWAAKCCSPYHLNYVWKIHLQQLNS